MKVLVIDIGRMGCAVLIDLMESDETGATIIPDCGLDPRYRSCD